MNVQHLNLMIELIDTCAQRGAFKGEELLAIGSLRHVVKSKIDYINRLQVDTDYEVKTEEEIDS